MRAIDLRQHNFDLDALLRSVGDDVLRITSRDGRDFVLEAVESFDREAGELGRSANFMAFLAVRSAEEGRRSLAEVEADMDEATGSE